MGAPSIRRSEINPNDPIRLSTAASLAFPDGSMTSSGLRKEALRGRLVIERIAGKDFTTLAHIERMRELCRVSAKARRLYKRKTKRKNGRLIANAVWTIRDGEREVATGIFASEAERKPPKAAEDALARYITSKYRPPRAPATLKTSTSPTYWQSIMPIARRLTSSEGPAIDITEFADRIGRLNDFFGGMMLAEVNAQTCGKYVKARGRRGGARRDLEDLRAAINHHSREGLHRGLVRVALPAKGRGRDRWLTRSEAAALVVGVLAISRSADTTSRSSEESKIETDKRPLRHIARFILIGLYTGTRAGAIASASPYRERADRMSILNTGSSTDSHRGRRPPKSGSRRRHCPIACSPTCDAGSGRT